MFIAESTRPNSQIKARNDFYDMEVILAWLVKHKVRIDFALYSEKPKDQLLPGFELLYKNHPTVGE
mgnify:CR=1 FL=1